MDSHGQNERKFGHWEELLNRGSAVLRNTGTAFVHSRGVHTELSRDLRAAGRADLNRRTGHRSIAAEDAAIPLLWFQSSMTSGAVVEK